MTTGYDPQTASDLKQLHQQIRLVAILGLLAFLLSAFPVAGLKIPQSVYLPVHTILEFSSAAVAFLVFATIWHAPKGEVTLGQLLIALALFAGGWLDVLHALSFKGMPDFLTPSSYIKGIDFWLGARLVISVTILMVSWRWNEQARAASVRYTALAMVTLINLVVIASILLFEDQLPPTYIDGQGVTHFKTVLEVISTSLLAWAAWRYLELARKLRTDELALLFGAVAIAALSEQFFAFYSDVRDLKNLFGHLYKILSYALVYRALFISNVRRPYEQLKQKTEKLMQADSLLRRQSLALESTSAAIFLTDRDGKLQWRNRAAASASVSDGEDPDEITLFSPSVTPNPVQVQEMRKALMHGQSWSGLVERRDPSGRRFMFQRVVSPLLSDSGEIEGFVSVSDDLTDRIRAAEWNKRVLDTAIDGFIALDAVGAIISTNQAYAAMIGYTAEELVGLHIADIQAVLSSEEVERNLTRIRDDGSARFETKHRNRNGEAFDVEVAAQFDAEIKRIFVFIRDLSSAKAAENSQRDLERQLQQAQKMEAFGQLTGGIAHDFNNILASILGYAKLAEKKFAMDPQSKLTKYLREIVVSTERARDLIARMMVYTRKTPSSRMEAIAPAAIVNDVIAMVSPSIPAGIQIDVAEATDDRILMDSGELTQVLMNLIVNARDAIGENGNISLGVYPFTAHGQICAITQERLFGSFVSIEVSDSGSGIAAADMPKLFDPFFTTKDVGKGTGLGLSMVQGIMRRAKAHILVESQLGAGSVFRLLFPGLEERAVKRPRDSQEIQELPRGDGRHIWVVDDEPAVSSYLEELLQEHGYQVTKFADPAAVMGTIQNDGVTCDLVITDKTMPGANGYQLASMLGNIKPNMPVILCTGYDSGRVDELSTANNIRRTFIKPVPPETILDAVAEELELVIQSQRR